MAVRTYLSVRVRELAASGLVAGRGNRLMHGLFVLTVAMPIIPAMPPRMVSEYFGRRQTDSCSRQGFSPSTTAGARRSWPDRASRVRRHPWRVLPARALSNDTIWIRRSGQPRLDTQAGQRWDGQTPRPCNDRAGNRPFRSRAERTLFFRRTQPRGYCVDETPPCRHIDTTN